MITTNNTSLSAKDIELLNSKLGIRELLRNKNININRVMRRLHYYDQLLTLQAELIKMQNWVFDKGKRVAILFEGRDAAGKGGAIRRFIEHMNPRLLRVVALSKPTSVEYGQWYFQRYIHQLPNPGEIVFFDRSWYNRAVVEPVNGFCTKKQYKDFMDHINEFELMLHKDGIQVIKFWFSITKKEQECRIDAVRQDPLKQWKLSPVDDRAIELWDEYSRYKEAMLSKTSVDFCPWVVIKADAKTKARVEAIKHVLLEVAYPKSEETIQALNVDGKVIESVIGATTE